MPKSRAQFRIGSVSGSIQNMDQGESLDLDIQEVISIIGLILVGGLELPIGCKPTSTLNPTPIKVEPFTR